MLEKRKKVPNFHNNDKIQNRVEENESEPVLYRHARRGFLIQTNY